MTDNELLKKTKEVVRRLLIAYDRGEERYGSILWEDVDYAYELANELREHIATLNNSKPPQ